MYNNYKNFLQHLSDIINREIGKIEFQEDNHKTRILQFRVVEKCKTIEPEQEKYTFGTWLERWYKLYKEPNNAMSTLYKQRNLIKAIQAHGIADIQLTDIKPLDVQEFINAIPAPRQREHFFVLIRDSLSKAYIANVINKDISKAIRLKMHKHKATKVLTTEQKFALIEECTKSPNGDFFLVMLYEGLRPSEVLGLQFENIDITKKIVRVRESMSSATCCQGGTKTEAGIRNIPIFDECLPIFVRLLKDITILDTKKRIFNTQKYREYGRIFKEICATAKISKDSGLIPYSLRHTFATNCAENKIPPKVLQKWLGHSDISLTLKYYIHVTDDYEQFCVDLLNNKE